jgi:hypothetical protein
VPTVDALDLDPGSREVFDEHRTIRTDESDRLGNRLADPHVTGGRDRHFAHRLECLDRACLGADGGDRVPGGVFETAAEGDGRGAGGELGERAVHQRPRQDDGGGGAVTGLGAGLLGDLVDETGAHVRVLIAQVDRLGRRRRVVGEKTLLGVRVTDEDAASIRSQRATDRCRAEIDSAQQRQARILSKPDGLRH